MLYEKFRFRICFFALFILIGFLQRVYPADPAISDTYFIQAKYFVTNNKIQAGENLLKSSLEFNPWNSDALYLLYQIYHHHKQDLPGALKFLEEAVDHNRWYHYDGYEGYLELTSLYYRMKEYDKAKKILLSLFLKKVRNFEGDLLFVKVLDRLGEDVEKKKILQEIQKKYPLREELYIFMGEENFRKGLLLNAVKSINDGLRLLPSSRELLFYKAKYTSAREDIEAYLSAGGANPEAAVLGSRIEKSEEYINFFLENGGASDIALLDRMVQLIQEDDILLEHLTGSEGFTTDIKVLDSNGDTFIEETYFYSKEHLSRWLIDYNQDGREEVEVLFKEGAPLSVRTEDAKLIYSVYPYVQSVHYTAARREYRLLSMALKHPLILEDPFSFQKFLREDTIIPEAGDLGPNIEKVFLLSGSGKPIAEEIYHQGEIYKESLDTDGDGFYDHILFYKHGLPYKGERDFEGDRVFEAKELFQKGRLSKISFDSGGDGLFEAVQEFKESGEVVFSWDYNFDGIYDAVQRIQGEEEFFSFATAYDGKLDLSLNFRKGILKNIKKGNTLLPVTRGEDNIFWIGEVFREIALPKTLQAGKHVLDGKPFFVFKYNGNIYIKEII